MHPNDSRSHGLTFSPALSNSSKCTYFCIFSFPFMSPMRSHVLGSLEPEDDTSWAPFVCCAHCSISKLGNAYMGPTSAYLGPHVSRSGFSRFLEYSMVDRLLYKIPYPDSDSPISCPLGPTSSTRDGQVQSSSQKRCVPCPRHVRHSITPPRSHIPCSKEVVD